MADARMPQGGRKPALPHKTIALLAREVVLAKDPAAAAGKAADELVQASALLADRGEHVCLASGRLAHFRRALREAKAPTQVIDQARRGEITTAANARRFERFTAPEGRASRGLAPPPFYQLRAVQGRLQKLDTKKAPSRQDAIDVMIAWAARPSELKNLEVRAGLVSGFSKSRGASGRPYCGMLEAPRAVELLEWVQAAVRGGQLPDPGVPGSKPYRALLAPHGLRPKDLRALGAEYAARVAGAPTDAMRMEVRRLALRHAPARVPTEYYSVVRKAPEEMELEEYLAWLLEP